MSLPFLMDAPRGASPSPDAVSAMLSVRGVSLRAGNPQPGGYRQVIMLCQCVAQSCPPNVARWGLACDLGVCISRATVGRLPGFQPPSASKEGEGGQRDSGRN